MKALIVDDHQFSCNLIERSLRGIGFTRIDSVLCCHDAIRKVAVERYSIFFVDWVLGGESGLDIVRHVRSTAKHQKTPIMMITGKGLSQEVRLAILFGVNDYVIKPIIPTVLEQKVRKLLTVARDGARLTKTPKLASSDGLATFSW